MDVYEWSSQRPTGEVGACHTEGGCVQLISAGTSPFDSSLLGASADGTDAYFFTRDTLVTSDENGPRVKIYDARVDGGFPQVPPPLNARHRMSVTEPAARRRPRRSKPPLAPRLEMRRRRPSAGRARSKSTASA